MRLNKKFIECDDAMIALHPNGWQYGRSAAAACKEAHSGRGFPECGDDPAEFQARLRWCNDVWLPRMNAVLAGQSSSETLRYPELSPVSDHLGDLAGS